MREMIGFSSNELMCVERSRGTGDVSVGSSPVSTCFEIGLYRSARPPTTGGRYLKVISAPASVLAMTTPSLKRKPWPRRRVKRLPSAGLRMLAAAADTLAFGGSTTALFDDEVARSRLPPEPFTQISSAIAAISRATDG